MGTAGRPAAARDLQGAGGHDMLVEIVDYDPSWPLSFEAERARIAPLLGGVELHHIGSTAVPGLAAKPIIDIMILVGSYEEAIATLVTEAGFHYPEAFNALLAKRRFLLYPRPSLRTHHLHLVDDPVELQPYLRFRDRLRTEPPLAHEYVALKRSLARRFSDNREAYTAAKTDFITRAARPPGADDRAA
jgi:GrpB-like predicted nucleotidyltransferase (UPF0157 family)